MKLLRSLILTVPLIVFSCALINPAAAGGAGASPREVRHIAPPPLERTNIKRKILCHRPVRHGSPKTDVEIIEGKVVATCAGHGGSGITLAPGSVEYVNNLLERDAAASDLTKETPITIIGGGIMGLFSAYNLVKRGYAKITIVAESFENLTSHNAGGLICPVSMDNNPEVQKLVDQMGIDAYKFYAAIARGENADIPNESAVFIVPTYFDTLEESSYGPYIEAGVMNPYKEVTLDFGTGTTRDMLAFDDGLFVNPSFLMKTITKFLTTSGFVTFEQRKIASFSEIPTKYIINCTGLGAAELTKDTQFKPIQGHLFMLKGQVPENLMYQVLIYFADTHTSDGFPITRSFYIFPKSDVGSTADEFGVVGGTFIEDATPATPHEEEFDLMLNRARAFYGLPPVA